MLRGGDPVAGMALMAELRRAPRPFPGRAGHGAQRHPGLPAAAAGHWTGLQAGLAVSAAQGPPGGSVRPEWRAVAWQSCAMVPGLDVQLAGADNYELAVRFLAEWVCDGAARRAGTWPNEDRVEQTEGHG